MDQAKRDRIVEIWQQGEAERRTACVHVSWEKHQTEYCGDCGRQMFPKLRDIARIRNARFHNLRRQPN